MSIIYSDGVRKVKGEWNAMQVSLVLDNNKMADTSPAPSNASLKKGQKLMKKFLHYLTYDKKGLCARVKHLDIAIGDDGKLLSKIQDIIYNKVEEELIIHLENGKQIEIYYNTADRRVYVRSD